MFRRWRDYLVIVKSGYFDPAYYLCTYPDIRLADIDPLWHFMYSGWKEGRNPGPLFDLKFYLDNNEDVRTSGINPLLHYIIFGKKEGRLPNYEEKIEKNLSSFQRTGFDKNHNTDNRKDNHFSLNTTRTTLKKIYHYFVDYGFRALITRSVEKLISSINTIITNRKNKGVIEYFERLYAGQSINNSEYVPDSDEYPYLYENDLKLIAFYLPQFHPIPENDDWWGKGFTEWTNVSKAIPNFIGHSQPHLPGELGFYDLRIPEVQKRQIELAKKYGIYGFCFHYYWFNGKRLLERPLNQFLENPDMDFPFCICWANENWTRRWDGLENEILIGQIHSDDENLSFIRDIIPILLDNRYIRVNGKPLLIVYRINLLPNPQLAVEIWRSECKKVGIGDIFLVAAQSFGITDPRPYGFDAAVEFPPHNLWDAQIDKTLVQVTNPYFTGGIFDYRKAIQLMKNISVPDYTLFRTVMPSWDNTARKQNDGSTFINSTPSAYKGWLGSMISYTKRFLPEDKRFVFINSWNEWGEGAYLEPDRLNGYAFLQATADAIKSPNDRRSKIIPEWTILFVSHDASSGGSQTALLNTIAWFKKHTTLSVKILCLDGGVLLNDFKKLADTIVLNELQQDGIEIPENQLTDRILDFCGTHPSLIYGNTVVSGRAYKWLSRLGVPILTHVHELEMSIQYYAAEWMNDIMEYSNHFLACSGAVKDNLIHNHGIPAEKISIGYASIYTNPDFGELGKKEKDKLKKGLGLLQGKRLIFGCGYGMPFRKGADLFIKLGEILRREGCDDFHLYWIGGFEGTEVDKSHGIWSNYLKNLEESGLRKYVSFLGLKKNPRDYFKVGDVFVLPSREEPFGLVALEAADCGLPSVCFENAGVADFVGEDAGFVVPNEDVEAMALKVIFLINNDELRRAIGVRAREKLLNGFTVEQATPTIFSICRQVAKQKPGVSVIVPNYNHANYLPQRLESIFNQAYQDFEVILLDDASTDNSMDVLEKYAGRGDVKILRNNYNTGSPFKQWLKGIELARSDILWMAESDDSSDPEFLKFLLPAFVDPNVKLAYANSYIIDEKGILQGDYLSSPYLLSLSPTKWQRSYKVSAEQEINDGLGVKDTILNASAVLFRKFELDKSFRDVFGDMRIAGDWFFVVNAIKDGKIHYDARKLNYHRRHSASVIGKILQGKKLEQYYREFCLVQKYIFNNYRLHPEFPGKWETYLRQQWDDFYPNRSFDELEEIFPFKELKEMIIRNSRGLN